MDEPVVFVGISAVSLIILLFRNYLISKFMQTVYLFRISFSLSLLVLTEELREPLL